MAQMITGLAETEKSRDTQTSLSKINKGIGMVGSEELQPPQYWVGLFTINKRRMPESELAFLVENGAYKTVQIYPCPADKRYIKVLDIPHPVQAIEADPNGEEGSTIVRRTKAERVAMSIVHPDVIGESMRHLPPNSLLAKVAISSNCDLIKQGVFFTREEEGSEGFELDLKAAEARLDATYRSLLDSLLGMSDGEIRRVLASEKGVDIRQASVHYGEDIPGIRGRSVKVDCPNCFEKVPQGAGFHRSEMLQSICVIDWKRAVEAGVKKKEDVPDSKRWWLEQPAAPKDDLSAELEAMTREQLVEFAATFGLELQVRIGKEALIAAIQAAAKGSAA
jgi:hypothetical protein